MNRLLVVDALNMFTRAWIVNPSLSTNGKPIGGTVGFLKILQKVVRETKPDGIVICWDGAGGSNKRKALNKNYKEGRSPIRFNRGDVNTLTVEESLKNKIWQQQLLVQILNEMPTVQLLLDNVEADDIISFIVQHPKYINWQKVIFSADKDFYQLCDDKTIIYRPPHKSGLAPEIANKHRIIENYGIHPTNFALARAIAGDKSDNLDGVPAVGMPTIAKRLPFLAEEKAYTVDEVVDFCAAVESPLKAHRNIVEHRSKIVNNYKLMQLYSPLISIQGKTFINETIKEFEPEFNKTGVQKMMIECGVIASNWTDLFTTCKRLVQEKKQNG